MLRKIYLAYTVLLPALAIVSARFLPVALPEYLTGLHNMVWFLLGCVMFGAIAVHWAYITEIEPFPTQPGKGVLVLFGIPLQLLMGVVLSNDSLWLVVFLQAGVSMIGTLIAVGLQIFERVMKGDVYWYGIIVLGSAIFVGVGGIITLTTSLISLALPTLLGYGSSIITISIQRFLQMRRGSIHSSIDNMGYILLGSGGTVLAIILAFVL